MKEKWKVLFQNKVLANRLSFVHGVKTIINHTTFKRPNGESGLPKQGRMLGLLETQLRKQACKARQDSPLHSALPAVHSLRRAFSKVRETELYILGRGWEQTSCRVFKDIIDYWSDQWVSNMQCVLHLSNPDTFRVHNK